MEVILDRAIERGRKEGRILEAVDIYKKEMKLDEPSIINHLVRKFGLTPEIARKYL